MATDNNNGRFVWYENRTKDVQAAVHFYSDVVGWKTQPFAEGSDYLMWVGSQGPLGGVMKLPEDAAHMNIPPHWIAHVQVADVDAAASAVIKLSGKVLRGPEDIPSIGRFAVIADPQGAVICMFKPNTPMTLHDPSKAQEICWNELLTSDSVAALKFYSEIFGWKLMQEMDMGPMGTYRIYGVGEQSLGGMMTIPAGAPMPPVWVYYVETPDLDAALGRATSAGARVLNGPMDVPGGGRIVQLMDPQGAAFALHQSPKK
ncbi:MAG TPA: VOC family protein [Terriglobia bacterium]|nr:VOC family protein [Terriglobia bacterium]